MWNIKRQKIQLMVSVFLLVIVSMVSPTVGKTIYVDADAPGTNDGSSWANAYNYLQDALRAGESGDEIRVAQGIYKPDQGSGIIPGDRTATFRLINGVIVKGSYAGSGPNPNECNIEKYKTILSGDLNGDDGPNFANYGDNCYHVVTSSGTDETAMLDGFTITAGSANGSYPHHGGGGMYNDGGSPTVINCTFRRNSASLYGGGMYNYRSSSPRVINCIFTGNSAEYYGAGVCNGHFSSPMLVNCTFNGNTAAYDVQVSEYWYSHPTLINCIIWNPGVSKRSGEESSVTVTYSDVQGGWSGAGNIDADPLFIDADGPDNVVGTEDDNLRLFSWSPCVDAGDTSAVPQSVLTDPDGNLRIIKGTVDMGAYERPEPDFLLSTKSILIPEGGVATFTVAMAMDPLGTVKVMVTHYAGDHNITVKSGASLTFDSSNYAVPQTVTLAAAEDWDSFNGSAQICLISTPAFATDRVIATEEDNDPPPNVLFVDAARGDDDSDGQSELTALATIQKAIDMAQRDGVTVMVADGTYASEGWQNYPVVDFRGKAITVRSKNGPKKCILSRGDYVVSFCSGETPASVLSGFTITGGDPGGGIICCNSSPTIINNIIIDNWSEYCEGAIYLRNSSAIISGNIISRHDDCCGGRYGSIGCENNSSPIITNNTITYNLCGGIYCDGSSSPAIANCILWGNGYHDLSGCSATYSCIERGDPGIGNISEDPRFLTSRNYRLQPNSPCIDAGDNTVVTVNTDLDNNARIVNGTVDMGAYEFPIPLWRYFKGTQEPPSNWKELSFDDSTWLRGLTGIGYGDGDDATVLNDMQGNYVSVYARRLFYVDVPTRLTSMVLTIDYDDGFVAYINGAEVARNNIDGSPPAFDTRANENHEASAGNNNPNPPENYDITTFIDQLVAGMNILALQGHNRALNSTDFSLIPSLSVKAVIYVDDDAPNDPGPYDPNISDPLENGTQIHPFDAIQEAIDAAQNGDIVILLDGTYTGDGNRDIDFKRKAITLRSKNGPENCIIDCNGTEAQPHRGFYFHRREDKDSVVDGLKIINGYAYGGWPNNCGGGIHCYNSSPTITNCIISRNRCTADWDGGGGGVFCHRSNAIINRCTITDNKAINDDGGGIMCKYASPIISNCVISGNSAKDCGGGIRAANSKPTIVNCIITGNLAGKRGGGIGGHDSFIISNCTISGNYAKKWGGGLYCEHDMPLLITVTNSILWNNTASAGGPEIALYSPNIPANTKLTVSYCNVKGGKPGVYNPNNYTLIWSEGNIECNPNFVKPGYWDAHSIWVNGDYHLSSEGWRWDAERQEWDFDRVTSKCIDAGNPGSPLGEELLTIPVDPNNEWGENLRIDMGAYGGTAEASIPPYGWALLADMTNDGIVDLVDLAYWLQNWLSSGNEWPADLDRNGIVNMIDFALLARDWFTETRWHK